VLDGLTYAKQNEVFFGAVNLCFDVCYGITGPAGRAGFREIASALSCASMMRAPKPFPPGAIRSGRRSFRESSFWKNWFGTIIISGRLSSIWPLRSPSTAVGSRLRLICKTGRGVPFSTWRQLPGTLMAMPCTATIAAAPTPSMEISSSRFGVV